MGTQFVTAATASRVQPRQTFLTSEWRRIREHGSSIAADFAQHLRGLARPRQIAYARLMKHTGGNPVGIECTNKDSSLWAFVLPNVANEHDQSAWRIQIFDADGFCSHHCHGTMQQAVEDMIKRGFHQVDAGALDRFSQTRRWQIGVECQRVRDLHNSARISFREMMDRLCELQNERSLA